MAQDPNEALLQKTIETGDLASGGALNPEQQAAFIVMVKKASVMLPQVRFIEMKQNSMEIDKLHVGEPVTISVDENTDPGILHKPKFNKIRLESGKVQSAWNVSTETLQENLEQEDFDATVMEAFITRISTDLELLAIQGDTTIVGIDPFANLLRRLDGWAKISEGGHIVNANGATVSKGMFSVAKRRMPKQYKSDPDLRFILSDTIATDWMDTVADRVTAVGDAALQGSGVAPFGIPLFIVNLIPDDIPVPSTAATPGVVKGTRCGPFTIGATNSTLYLNVNGGGAFTVVLTQGVLETVEIARQLNVGIAAQAPPGNQAVAQDDGEGRVEIRTSTTGVGATIVVGAGANDVAATLGITAGNYQGAAAGAGMTPDGSFMWLGNFKNFIWGILDGTRIFSEFNKNFDRVETVMYNQVAAQIENLDAIVKVKNIRRKPEVI